MNTIIEIQQLGKKFRGKNRTTVEAVKNIDLKVRSNTIFGFVGPNGAGKSTTIKMLMGFLKPDCGSASLCEIPVSQEKCRSQIGYLPENPAFHPFLSAREVLTATASLRGMSKKDISHQVPDLLDKVALLQSAKRPVGGFSKGMIQRLSLANALLGSPNLLIFDEPMSGLDPLGRNLVHKIIIELQKQGKTIFFSSHILHDVETTCDEVAIMLNGSIKFQGQLDTIIHQQSGSCEIRILSEQSLAELKENLKGLYQVLTPVKKDLFDIMVSPNHLDTLLPMLLHKQCRIVHLQQSQQSLEKYFMELVHCSET